jgi:hypothetical protein
MFAQAAFFPDEEPEAQSEPQPEHTVFRTHTAQAQADKRAPGAKHASKAQRDLLRTMIAERKGQEGIDAIRTRLNKALDGGFLIVAIFQESFEALKAIPRNKDAANDQDSSSQFVVWPGTYTIEDAVDGGHRTFEVVLQSDDADFAPGKLVIGFLSGPNNSHDFTSFGFIKPGPRLVVWKRFRDSESLLADAEKFLADPEAALKTKYCGRCGDKLSVPLSIERGYGPWCYQQVNK